MKKNSIILLCILYCSMVHAQSKIESVLNNNEWPYRENFEISIEDALQNKTHIPITILKGKNEGPVFTIVAGIHGYEYPPIIAAQELLQEIDEKQLSGTLIIIPVANTAAFYNRTLFLNPLDQLNLNRTFPGSEDGTITQKMAHFITNEIIAASDIFLDIHGGDANEDLLPFVCYYNNEQKPEQTNHAKVLSEASGFQYIVSYPYTLKANQPALYAFKQAVQDGKVALSIESGKLGMVQSEAVSLIKNGVYNILNQMNMYGDSPKVNEKVIRVNQQAYIKATEKGIFVSDKEAGDTIEEGELIGYIKDEFGNTTNKLTSKYTGIILYKIGTPPVNIGETMLCIGYGFEE